MALQNGAKTKLQDVITVVGQPWDKLLGSQAPDWDTVANPSDYFRRQDAQPASAAQTGVQNQTVGSAPANGLRLVASRSSVGAGQGGHVSVSPMAGNYETQINDYNGAGQKYIEYQGNLNGSLTQQQAYIPNWVSLDHNIRTAMAQKAKAMDPHVDPVYGAGMLYGWLDAHVRDHGPMDYKRARKQTGVDYENFGNFNYGAVGAALGIPDETLLKAAGIVQLRDGNSTAGYARSNFDDPKDQLAIKAGIEYYRRYYTGGVTPPNL